MTVRQITDMLPPPEILAAAELVARWFAERNLHGWQYGPVADRALVPTTNPMCEFKTNSIMHIDGYKKTGYVLMHDDPNARICVSDQGAVSWFSRDQWWWLMHNRDHVEFEWPKPLKG